MDLSFTAPGCPWSEYELGNLVSCEARLCSWVRQPMNTVSNVAFLMVATILLLRYRRGRHRSDLHFAILCTIVGAASAIGHAAQTRVLLYPDYLSQFLVFAYLIATGAARLNWIHARFRNALALLLVTVAFAPTLLFRPAGAYLVGTFITILFVTEWTQHRRYPAATTHWLKGAVVFLVAALLCYELDTQRIVCDPSNHWFQLHSLWHILSAASLGLVARHHLGLPSPAPKTHIRTSAEFPS